MNRDVQFEEVFEHKISLNTYRPVIVRNIALGRDGRFYGILSSFLGRCKGYVPFMVVALGAILGFIGIGIEISLLVWTGIVTMLSSLTLLESDGSAFLTDFSEVRLESLKEIDEKVRSAGFETALKVSFGNRLNELIFSLRIRPGEKIFERLRS